jgi:hypothetical protein
MEIKINVHLKDLPVIDYRALEESQGNLKTLSKENYDRFRNSLIDQGQLAPFFLWVDPETEKFLIIDGHQRKKIFNLEKVIPFERPYLLVPGETFEQAKKAALAISSQYGTITEQGLNEYTFEFPSEWVHNTVHFDALSKQFEKSIKPALSAFPEDIEIKSFTKTHLLLSFPPDKLIEIQDLLKPILEKPYVEYEQGSN